MKKCQFRDSPLRKRTPVHSGGVYFAEAAGARIDCDTDVKEYGKLFRDARRRRKSHNSCGLPGDLVSLRSLNTCDQRVIPKKTNSNAVREFLGTTPGHALDEEQQSQVAVYYVRHAFPSVFGGCSNAR